MNECNIVNPVYVGIEKQTLPQETCKWTYTNEHAGVYGWKNCKWDYIDRGDVDVDKWNYCPYCGRKIEIERIK